MTPAESVAQRTWATLERAKQLRAKFGEESLTDLLVLDMLPHRRARGFSLLPTTKKAEGVCGADLFVGIRHRSGRWSRFVVQAKKLYPSGNYMTLYGAKAFAQLTRLEQFACQLQASPLYLLYNYTSTVQPSHHWHCVRCFVASQLGCTLVPSWRVRQMFNRRRSRSFDFAHKVDQSMPWRCAFDCPFCETRLLQMGFRSQRGVSDQPAIRQYDWPFEPTEAAWPEWIFDESKTDLTEEDIDRIRNEIPRVSDLVRRDTPGLSIDSDGSPLYPARFLLVDQL